MQLAREKYQHFKTFTGVETQLKNMDTKVLDPVPLNRLELSGNRLLVGKEGYSLTDKGLSDVFSKAKMRTTHHGHENLVLWKAAINEYFRKHGDKQLVSPVIRSGNIVAIMGPKYKEAFISNLTHARKFMEQLDSTNFKFFAADFSPSRFRIVAVDKKNGIQFGDNGETHFMSIDSTNSETGGAAWKLLAQIFTNRCTNLSQISGNRAVDNVRLVHRGDLNTRIEDELPSFIGRSSKCIDYIGRALPMLSKFRIDKDSDFCNLYQQRLALPMGGKKNVEQYFDDREFPVNGYREWYNLTETARDTKSLDRKIQLEEAGGWLLDYVYRRN
jgi:hypothetical protein